MYRSFGFIVLSLVILYISRKSILQPGSHGFYRFFAWEVIAGLFFLNVNAWFRHPFSWNQLISWILLIFSLVPLGFGVRSLVKNGQPAQERAGEPGLLGFEKTTRLVTSGIYRYIRHPLYSSLLFLTWGIAFKAISLGVMVLAVAASLLLVATARADEAECARYFGAAYQEYKKHSKMFVPFVF